jgi:phosphoserine phosphatase
MSTLRLAVLDVDGTLKRAESPYQYLHELLGVEHLAKENRRLALAGEIAYGEWLARDVVLWKGQPVSKVRALLARNPYMPGAPELLRALNAAGVTIALVSAGFTLNTDPIVEEFGIHHALANELGICDGLLDGTAINHVPEQGKATYVRELMASLRVTQAEVLAAGDTRGDLELFACAGVCMAVNPVSDELRARADVVLEPDLRAAVTWLRAGGWLPG